MVEESFSMMPQLVHHEGIVQGVAGADNQLKQTVLLSNAQKYGQGSLIFCPKSTLIKPL